MNQKCCKLETLLTSVIRKIQIHHKLNPFGFCRTEVDTSPLPRGHLPDVEDDDFDPNYARINNFRDPPPTSHASYPNRMPSPLYVPPTGSTHNIPPTNEDPREGLYAKVNKIKPASHAAAER